VEGAEAGDDAFGAIAARLARTAGRPTGALVVTAHNLDEVTVVDRIVPDHECEAQRPPTYAAGGSGANTAHWLAALGTGVRVAGCVGDDADGKFLVDSLAGVGVDVELVERVPATPSGRTVDIVDRHGGRLLVVQPGANDHFARVVPRPGLVEASRSARVVHLSSFADPDALRAQVDLVRALDDDVVVSLVPGALYARLGLDGLGPLLDRTDVLFLYREQLEALVAGSSARRVDRSGDRLRDLLDTFFTWKARRPTARPQVLVVKQPLRIEEGRVAERFLAAAAGGARLERLVDPRGRTGAGARAVDTTGAGDATAAAFLHALLAGAPLEDCLDAGFLLASFASTAVGARAAYTEPAETETAG
jgi:ribokinase